MSASVRIGVLGCGTIARAVHLPVLLRTRGATVVAAADPDADARASAAALARDLELGDDPLALARDRRVDAIVVCAPTGVHAELGLAALAAGKHLYLEKPLATSLADGRRLAEAAADAGVVAAIGFNRRFHPAFRRARAAVAAGRLGAVRKVETSFREPIATALPAWKQARASGGGAFLDLGSHHVDLVRWILATEVELAGAELHSRSSEDDEGRLLLRLDSGGDACLNVSFHGSRADVVRLDGDRRTLRADRYGGMRARLRPLHDPSYRLALHAFVRGAAGAPVAVPTLADGLRSLEVVIAAEEAAV